MRKRTASPGDPGIPARPQERIWRDWPTRRIVLFGFGLTTVYMAVQILIYRLIGDLFISVGAGAVAVVITARAAALSIGGTLSSEFDLARPQRLQSGLAILAAVAAVLPFSVLASFSTRIHPPSEEWLAFYAAALPHNPFAVIIAALAVVILAPLAEELIFRGIFYRICRRHWGATGSAVITALFFALVHGEPWIFFGLFTLGLMLAFIYETTSSLSTCVATHAVHNAISLGLILRNSNPSDPQYPQTEITPAALAASLVALFLILLFLYRTRRR